MIGKESESKYEESDASFQEKFLGLITLLPVPRTNTRGQGENPKVSERTIVKELGKMTP